jgi:glucose-1-phosphate cytidylyltransferase
MTVVRPPARFGEVTLKGHLINFFKEKPQISSGWINGGFFVFNTKIFKFIKKYTDMLEKSPLEGLVKKKQLVAYKHYGFWQCMDTLRDKNLLNKLIKNKKAPWIK